MVLLYQKRECSKNRGLCFVTCEQFSFRRKLMTLQKLNLLLVCQHIYKASDRLFDVMFYIRLTQKFMIPQGTFDFSRTLYFTIIVVYM